MQYSLLNLFRFLAAYLVVLHHFAYRIPPFDEGFLNNFIGNGHFAVTFFFVLSGFVMVISNQKTTFINSSEKIRFWKKRAIRLLPLYYFAILLFILFQLGVNWPIKKLELILNLFGLQAWSLNAYAELNPPAWSLSVEFLFYFLTPFILLYLSKIKLRSSVILTGIIWFVTIVVFVMLMLSYGDEKLNFNFFPLIHISTFLIGIITGKIWLKDRDQIKFNNNHRVLLLVIVATLVCTFNTTYFHGKHIALFAPMFAILIYLFTLFERSVNIKLPSKTFNFLGDLSYPIYILHWPFIKYFHYYIGDGNNMEWLLKYSVGLIFFCVIVNLTIDRYFKKWYKRI